MSNFDLTFSTQALCLENLYYTCIFKHFIAIWTLWGSALFENGTVYIYFLISQQKFIIWDGSNCSIGNDKLSYLVVGELTLSPPNKLSSAKFLICFNFQSASMSLKVFEMLSKCQTAWIRVRRRVTRRLIRVQAVCIWHFGCAWRAKS